MKGTFVFFKDFIYLCENFQTQYNVFGDYGNDNKYFVVWK